jgi:hypothetical protein
MYSNNNVIIMIIPMMLELFLDFKQHGMRFLDFLVRDGDSLDRWRLTGSVWMRCSPLK